MLRTDWKLSILIIALALFSGFLSLVSSADAFTGKRHGKGPGPLTQVYLNIDAPRGLMYAIEQNVSYNLPYGMVLVSDRRYADVILRVDIRDADFDIDNFAIRDRHDRKRRGGRHGRGRGRNHDQFAEASLDFKARIAVRVKGYGRVWNDRVRDTVYARAKAGRVVADWAIGQALPGVGDYRKQETRHALRRDLVQQAAYRIAFAATSALGNVRDLAITANAERRFEDRRGRGRYQGNREYRTRPW